MTEPMMCAQCGAKRLWPADFPNRIYAVCFSCCEERDKPHGMWARFVDWWGK